MKHEKKWYRLDQNRRELIEFLTCVMSVSVRDAVDIFATELQELQRKRVKKLEWLNVFIDRELKCHVVNLSTRKRCIMVGEYSPDKIQAKHMIDDKWVSEFSVTVKPGKCVSLGHGESVIFDMNRWNYLTVAKLRAQRQFLSLTINIAGKQQTLYAHPCFGGGA